MKMRRILLAVSTAALLFHGGLGSALAQSNPTIPEKDIRVVNFEELRYAPLARAARIQGIVVVQVTLDDAGKVKDAEAISGPALLVKDCLTNAKQWRFEPNSEKKAVIIYRFEMPGGLCKSSTSFFMFRGPNLASIIGCDVSVETTETSSANQRK